MILVANNVTTRYGFAVPTAYIRVREVYHDYEVRLAKITYAIFGVNPEVNTSAQMIDTMFVAAEDFGDKHDFTNYFGEEVQSQTGVTVYTKANEYLQVTLGATPVV